MSSSLILPSELVANILNNELQASSPKLRLNNVDPIKFERKEKDIYLPDDDSRWSIYGSFFEINGRKTQIRGVNPINRRRRSNYIMDFNSNSFQIFYNGSGLTLRVEFETDGNEIKGWNRKARIKGRRDRSAADANITAPANSDFPFIEIDINEFRIEGNKIRIVQPSDENIRVGMNVDGNGFLELIDGFISRKVRNQIKNEIVQNWSIFAESLEAQIIDSLSLSGLIGSNSNITSIDFDGNRTYIGLDTNVAHPFVNQIFSYFNHTLAPNNRHLTLIGLNSINGTGNSLSNRIRGNDANNSLYGISGNDTMYGKNGDDFLRGGIGNDRIYGDSGNDLLYGESGNDRLYGSSGIDRLYGGENDDYLSGGSDNDRLYGNSGNDSLFGSNGIDRLYGGENDDYVSGGTGNDFMYGENGDDRMFGGDGDDLISGGLGNNTLSGELGDDTFIVDSTEDIVIENANEGIDTVYSSINYYLYQGQNINIENLTLTGLDSIGGAGNNLDNRIIGNNSRNVIGGAAGKDTLEGGDGNDLLNGGEGDDSLIGGKGDDDYRIDSVNDVVVEKANEGTDVVYVSEIEEYTLGNNVENLLLQDGNTLNAFGNNQRNQIGGNSNNNLIRGFEGDDVLGGAAGNDTLEGGDGQDRLRGGDGIDLLTGGRDQDLITGDGGADIFRFDSLDGSVDTITDFSAATGDKIEISASFGGGITVGVLDASQFTIGSSASTTDHHIIYNDRTGGLFFDTDGIGEENQVQFAILSDGLTSNDIFVI